MLSVTEYISKAVYINCASTIPSYIVPFKQYFSHYYCDWKDIYQYVFHRYERFQMLGRKLHHILIEVFLLETLSLRMFNITKNIFYSILITCKGTISKCTMLVNHQYRRCCVWTDFHQYAICHRKLYHTLNPAIQNILPEMFVKKILSYSGLTMTADG